MGRLVLIRHAQASFLAPDYDRLSPLGERQAQLLGEYWAQRRVMFDRIFTGPRARQKGTAKIAARAYRAAEVEFPEPIEMAEFDEYDGEAVLRTALSPPEAPSPFRPLLDAFLRSADPSEQRRNFQPLFEAVIGKWVEGEVMAPGVESWPEFCARVNRGLSSVIADAKPREQVAVFSSGGPIAVAMQRALNLSPRDTLRTSWMSRNCSHSEFLFSQDRFTLSSFNAYPYLDDSELWTYR